MYFSRLLKQKKKKGRKIHILTLIVLGYARLYEERVGTYIFLTSIVSARRSLRRAFKGVPGVTFVTGSMTL